MNKLQAYLHSKPLTFTSSQDIKPIVLIDLVELSASDFLSLCHRPTSQNHPFLKPFLNEMRFKGGATQCLMATTKDNQNAVLIDAEGSEYVRYGAFMPGGAIYLRGLIDTICEDIINEFVEEHSRDTHLASFDFFDHIYGLRINEQSLLTQKISERLNQHPAIKAVGIEADGLSITRNPDYVQEHKGLLPLSPSLRLQDLLMFEMPQSTYLVHKDVDVGFVPIGGDSIDTLSADARQQFRPLLNATVERIEKGAYGLHIVLGNVDASQMIGFDEYQAKGIEPPLEQNQ